MKAVQSLRQMLVMSSGSHKSSVQPQSSKVYSGSGICIFQVFLRLNGQTPGDKIYQTNSSMPPQSPVFVLSRNGHQQHDVEDHQVLSVCR